MGEAAHRPQTFHKNRSVPGKRLHQVAEFFALHDANFFQAAGRVIAQLQRPFLNAREPSLEAGEIKRILFARIHQQDRLGSL